MEWITAFLTSARSRLSNPLLGSFIISWLLWNWEIILVIFGSRQTNLEKIVTIKAEYSEYLILLAGPAVTSIVLSLLLPYLNEWAERIIFNPVEIKRLRGRKALTLQKVELEKIDADYQDNEALRLEKRRLLAELEEAQLNFTQETAKRSSAEQEIAKLTLVNEDLSAKELEISGELEATKKQLIDAEEIHSLIDAELSAKHDVKAKKIVSLNKKHQVEIAKLKQEAKAQSEKIQQMNTTFKKKLSDTKFADETSTQSVIAKLMAAKNADETSTQSVIAKLLASKK